MLQVGESWSFPAALPLTDCTSQRSNSCPGFPETIRDMAETTFNEQSLLSTYCQVKIRNTSADVFAVFLCNNSFY